MASHVHHAPADCPVCGEDLIVTRKGCRSCGTELAGEFASCSYCGLEASELALLKVFLSSRGNLREVEKFLGVSYPTARARLDAVIGKLGFTPPDEDSGDEEMSEDTIQRPSAQEQVLARVASGELSAETAATLLAGL